MTEPTQAQIEAAATAYENAFSAGLSEYDCLKAALTAAAQVGEPTDIFTQVNANIKAAEARTIERCAQVAESSCCCAGKYNANAKSGGGCLIQGCPQKIAAAIRALADEGLPTAADVRGILRGGK